MSRFAILGSRGYPSSYGGFETLVRYLAPHLVGEGHDVVVYGRTEEGARGTQTIDRVEVRRTAGLGLKSTSTLSFGLTASLDLARRPCDAALVLNVANGFYLPLLSRAGIATCVNVDGLEWTRGKWGPVARSIFLNAARATARHADALVYDSEALGRVWLAQFGRDGHFIPYGAPVLDDVGSERVRAAGLPPGGYVLAVARIVPENNVDLLLDALDRLEHDAPVVIVGGSNYDHPTVRRLARLKEDGRIHWLGHVSDQELLNELWANAAAYWHGHSVGGTNPSLLQALGAGAPTVAFDTPFNREVIRHESQLVGADPAEVAARLDAVLGSQELAASFRERGRTTVAERYSWDDVCRSYQLLLERLAEAKAPADGKRRHGKVVAVVGPDGAGKSRLTRDIEHALETRLQARIDVVNFRSGYLDRALRRRVDGAALATAAANPHATQSRGTAAASAKALALWLDLVWSFWMWRRRDDRGVTIVERYAYDLVVDPARLGLTRAPRPLREFTVRLAPSPDVIVMCSAPPAVVRARKPELDETEISRQYGLWQSLRAAVDVPFIDVDTTEPVDADDLTSRILAVIES